MFDGCHDLSNIIIPECCEKIEAFAFSLCSALQEVRIPPSVTTIDNGAFIYCILNVIYCAPGSAAMEYARKHGIQCKPL